MSALQNDKIRCFSLFHIAITFFLLTITLKVNADVEIPKVHYSVEPLNLSTPPTTEELMSAGQLGGQLYPTHELGDRVRADEINLSFGEAIQSWNKHEYKKAVELFWKHIEKYPDSPWLSEALLHVGCDALYNGRYKESLECFNRIIDENKNRGDYGAKKLALKAISRRGYLKVLQNNFKAAMRDFEELKEKGLDWRDRTFASSWIQAISRYKATEVNMLDCGVRALAYVIKKEGNESASEQVANTIPSSRRGHSITHIKYIAKKHGYTITGLRVTVADLKKVPLPAIVQVSGSDSGDRGHYWVLDEINKDLLTFFDPQSGRRFEQNTREFSAEWSGNLLVISDKKALPGRRLTNHEMTQTYGGCCGLQRLPGAQGHPGRCAGPSSGGKNSCGSPTWSVNMVNLSLFVTDTPLWYSSPIGPSVNISLSYNSQASITEYEPFGNKWQFNYGTYLVVDSGGVVTAIMPDGRNDIYTPDGSGGYTKPYQVFNTLTKIAENHFEMAFPEGTVYVYNIPSGTTSLQPFLVAIRDAHGQQLTFGYNTAVQLTTITDAMGRVTRLMHNTRGLITGVTDPFGRFASFEYDAHSNLIRMTDMGGYWSILSYDSDVYLTGIESERGRWTFYIEPAVATSNGMNPYPAPGGTMWENYRITVTNPLGGKEEYHYDGYHRQAWYVSPRDYVAYVNSSNNNYTNAKKTHYTYYRGQRGEIDRVTYPGGGYIDYNYDSSGNRNSLMDSHGHTVRNSYNSMSRVTSTTDPRGNVTNTTYASNGIDLLQIQNGLGSITMAYNNTHDITAITDRLGKTTSFAYNSYGQITSGTNAMGVVTNYAYNTNHQLQQVAVGGQALESFTYDAVGRVRTHTNATGLALTYDYNNLDNITRITYPDGSFVSYSYSSCCPHLKDSETDRSGRTVSYTYDALKRLTEVTNPEGGVIKYAYDANGNMTQLIDTNNHSTSFEYDGDNRLVKKFFANSDECNPVEFTYDNAGLLTARTNARDIRTSYTYDANHNLTTIRYSDGTPGVTYQYDNYNRLTQRQDEIGTHTFSYDATSDLISIDGPWADDTVSYQYDTLGRRTGITPQGGSPLSYTYDMLDRLTNIRAGTSTGAYAYTYAGANPLVQSLSRPNNSATTYQYDSLKRLTGVSNKNSASAIINQYVYAYNNRDLRTSETITNGMPITTFRNESITYNYNVVNQLTSTVSPSMAFVYDEDGNMRKGYTPDGYVFTAAYDAEDRLKSLEYTDNSGIVRKTTYHYRGDSFLAEVKAYANGASASDTRFVRDGLLPLQERDASNSVVRAYTWGLNMGGGIGGLLNLKQGGQDYAYLYDGKGNVTTLLSSSQAVITTYTYDAFGNLMAKTGTVNQPYQFSTKAHDETTGLSYYGYRFYTPASRRWINRDPIGERGGMNLYGFVGNNPLNSIDSDGRVPLPLVTGFIGGLANGLASAWIQWARDGRIDWGDVGIAFVVGSAAGAAAPYTATTYVGAALSSGLSNLLQYVATQKYHGCEADTGEALGSTGLGLVGGLIGGPVKIVSPPSGPLMFAHGRMDPRLVNALNNDILVGLNTGREDLLRNLGGAVVGNVQDTEQCGCKR